MTSMTHRATGFAGIRHHPLTDALLVFLYWIAAAVLVATCHIELDARSALAGAAAAIIAIAVVARMYTHLCARSAGIDHALGAGIAWLVLAIVTEIAVSARTGRGWYALLGSPHHPLTRNLFMFVWVFAPALFAQRRFSDGD